MSQSDDPRETAEWHRVKQDVLKRDQYRCQSCGWTENTFHGIDLHVHHINSVKDGGGNDPKNLVVLCNRCHNRVHQNGPVDGEYPASLAGDRGGTYFSSRDNYTPSEEGEQVVQVLQENGPTKKKHIQEHTGIKDWKLSKALDHLKFGKLIGSVRRGVYGYIPRKEYERIEEEVEQGKDIEDIRYTAYHPHDPETPELYGDEFVGDNTCIQIPVVTKLKIDDLSGEQSAGSYISDLVDNPRRDVDVGGDLDAARDAFRDLIDARERLDQEAIDEAFERLADALEVNDGSAD